MSVESDEDSITTFKNGSGTESVFIKEELYFETVGDGDETTNGPSKIPVEPLTIPFCALCLRECTSDVLVRFSSQSKRKHIDSKKGQRKLQQVLGLTVALDNGVICRSCWKLVQILGEFRQCCHKSASFLERFSRGMHYEPEGDSWLSADIFDSLDAVHTAIQDNRKRIELEEVNGLSPTVVEVVKKVRKKPVKADVQIESLSEAEDVVVNESSEIVDPTLALLGDDNYNPSILACEKCGRKLDGITAHRMHVKRCTSSKKRNFYTCKICKATFRELGGLKYHMNKHNGVRPLKCRKFCDRTFSSNFVRMKHERGICEVDGRICSTCGARLKNELSLKRHTERVHGEAKYVCATCSMAFRTSNNLRNHQRVHSDERKYPCKVCDKAYKSPYAVRVHMRLHTQDRPFPCHLCEQVFNYKVSLKSHMERHHGQAD